MAPIVRRIDSISVMDDLEARSNRSTASATWPTRRSARGTFGRSCRRGSSARPMRSSMRERRASVAPTSSSNPSSETVLRLTCHRHQKDVLRPGHRVALASASRRAASCSDIVQSSAALRRHAPADVPRGSPCEQLRWCPAGKDSPHACLDTGAVVVTARATRSGCANYLSPLRINTDPGPGMSGSRTSLLTASKNPSWDARLAASCSPSRCQSAVPAAFASAICAESGNAPSMRPSATRSPPSSTTATAIFQPLASAWSFAAAITRWAYAKAQRHSSQHISSGAQGDNGQHALPRASRLVCPEIADHFARDVLDAAGKRDSGSAGPRTFANARASDARLSRLRSDVRMRTVP